MILECENLSKNYGSVKVLDNLTLKIESGKIVGLLGPNGHGKTTLIKTLSGLLSKDKGKVMLHSDVDELRMEKEKSVDALFREVFSC